jgi:predicted ATP-grasp superfamily ATP-dependent carboligase
VKISKQKKVKSGAIIVGGHTQGLGIARMLGRYGIPIVLIDRRTFNLTRYSKFCSRFLKAPNSLYKNNTIFSRFMISICIKYKLHDYVIFPTDDITVAFLSKNRKILSKYYKIWTQKWDIIKYCYDKKLTYRKAMEIGLPIPKSYFPIDESDLNNATDIINFPLILKPAVMHEFYQKTKRKLLLARNEQELVKNYQNMIKIVEPSKIIIQEIIPGSPKNLYSLGSFFDQKSLKSSFVGRRSRQLPMDFGIVSTYVEITKQPKVLERGTKILRSLNYYGLSEVEFKYDQRDGEYKLLEINPRTWKWHSIGLLKGINLPLLLYCDLTKQNIREKPRNQKKCKLKWIDISSDLYVSIKGILKGNVSMGEYMKSLKGKKVSGTLVRDDPLPFLIETIIFPYLLWSR